MTMTNVDQKQAEELLRAKDFSGALPIFENLWANEATRDEWIGWNLARSLRGLQRSADALDVCREVYRLKPDFRHNKELYAWCIYDLHVKKPSHNEQEFFRAVNGMVGLAEPGQLPHTMAVFAALKHLKTDDDGEAQLANPNEVLQWVKKLTPDLLSCVSKPGQDGRPFPSDYERYASARSKALLELRRAEDVLTCCAEAQAKLGETAAFGVWFKWREGKALAILGRNEEAAMAFGQVLAVKRDWFVHQALAESLKDLARSEQALYHAAQAALGRAPIPFKWKLYVLLADILRQQDQLDLARLHVQLAYSVRVDEGWKESKDLAALLAALTYQPKQDGVDVRQVERKLQLFWKSIAPVIETTHSGLIKQIHANGKSGVVIATTGATYFFGMKNVVQGGDSIQVDQQVRFNLKSVVNHRTQQQEDQAVDILSVSEESR